MIEYKKPRILVVKEEHPEKVSEKFVAGVLGCPEEFGFLGHEECSEPVPEGLNSCETLEYNVKMCTKCWRHMAVRRI